MIWQSIRPSRLRLRSLSRPARALFAQRCIANFPVTGQNIASILNLPSLGENDAPRPIEVTGHIRTIRNQKRRSFVELGDGSTIHSLQVLLEPSQALRLGTGTAVTISGSWRPCPQGKEQSHELHGEKVTILGTVDPDAYPLQKKYHTAEFLRTIPHLRLRTPFNALLARLRSDCEFYISSFYRTNQYVRLAPPIITSSDCEGAGEVFTVKPKDGEQQSDGKTATVTETEEFFRAPKFLTVSSQLHLEAFVHEHQRVWALSPTFRAEKSDTPRHLSEFYMLEAELRTENLGDVMDVVENMIRDVAVKVEGSDVGKELLGIKHTLDDESAKGMSSRSEVIQRRWKGLKRAYWPRITYTKAIELLQAAAEAKDFTFQYKPDWNSGLQLEHEKFIASEVGQGSPVFVTDYPQHVKAFYMLPSDMGPPAAEDRTTVACFDLLLPEICEVAGGSLREHRLQPLLLSMQRHGLVPKDSDVVSSSSAGNLDWYLDLRRYGSVPHGGFGLGFDRLLSYLAGVENIREMVPWPRYHGKCDC